MGRGLGLVRAIGLPLGAPGNDGFYVTSPEVNGTRPGAVDDTHDMPLTVKL